jgi:hypothetical protein
MPGTIAIAAYRTRVLALLDDPTNIRYSNTMVDQAIRMALTEYSEALPLTTSYIYQADGTQKMTLPADFATFAIYGVEDQAAYPPIRYTFYAFMEGEQWVIETPRNKITAGTALTILYGGLQQIDALDSAAGTTIPDQDADIFSLGSAGFALQMRANSNNESIIANPATIAIQKQQAEAHLDQFRAFLARPGSKQIASEWKLDTDKGY